MIESPRRYPSIWLLAGALLLFSIWDFYIESVGLRPFDILGFLILISCLLPRLALHSSQFTFGKGRNATFFIFVLFCLSCVFATMGVTADSQNIKPTVGFMLGIVVFVVFYKIKIIEPHKLSQTIDLLLIVHGAFFILQWSYYYLSGDVLNFHVAFGVEPRAMSIIFRATGLMLEPASYATTIIMLLVIRQRLRPTLGWVGISSLITVVLSLSTWGILASILFLLFNGKWRNIFLGILLILVWALVIQGTFLQESKEALELNRRISMMETHPSAQTRYVEGVENVGEGRISTSRFLIGGGISNDYRNFGLSGFAFILSSFGLIGSTLFFLILFILTAPSFRLQSSFFILLFLTAAPVWTCFFWWACLALVIRKYEDCEPRYEHSC